MKRSELLQVAERIIKSPLEKTVNKCGLSFSGLYLKRSIDIYTAFDEEILAIFYNRVCYLLTPVSARKAGEICYLYRFHNCNTKVALYPSTNYSIKDEDGEVKFANQSYNIQTNYSALIPIPFVSA